MGVVTYPFSRCAPGLLRYRFNLGMNCNDRCTQCTGCRCPPLPTYRSVSSSSQQAVAPAAATSPWVHSMYWLQVSSTAHLPFCLKQFPTGCGSCSCDLPSLKQLLLKGNTHCLVKASNISPSSHKNSAASCPCSLHMWNLSHCCPSDTKYFSPSAGLEQGTEG